RLAPDDVVEHPESQILKLSADPEDVVVAADYPERPGLLQDPARSLEPGSGEAVVGREVAELVPGLVDPVDPAVVGAMQVAGELQIIGRIGEDQIDGSLRQPGHDGQAIADDHAIDIGRLDGSCSNDPHGPPS